VSPKHTDGQKYITDSKHTRYLYIIFTHSHYPHRLFIHICVTTDVFIPQQPHIHTYCTPILICGQAGPPLTTEADIENKIKTAE